MLPSVVLWALAIAGLLVFAWRAGAGKSLIVEASCSSFAAIASVVALMLAVGGLSHKPAEESPTTGESIAASDKSTPPNPSPQSTTSPAAPRFRYAVTDLGTLGGDTSPRVWCQQQRAGSGRRQHAERRIARLLWEAGRGMRDLGTLGWRESKATGINNKGRVVGMSKNAAVGFPHLFLWEADRGMQDLGTPTGAASINDNGAIVTMVSTLTANSARGLLYRAVLWQGGRIQDLGTLGGESSFGCAINNCGQAVGMAMNAADESTLFSGRPAAECRTWATLEAPTAWPMP